MKIKVAGFALMGILAMMIIPGNVDSPSNDHTFYGSATMIQKDGSGQEIFSQTVHNRILDVGELYLLNQTFQEPTALALADNIQIGSICISQSATVPVEALTAATFDSNDSLTENNCKQDESVSISIASQTATVGSLQFTCGGTNCADDDVVRTIGICQNQSAGSADYANCASGGTGSGGILFAAVDVTDTTLGTSETVDITYTFDISSSGT